MKKIDYKKYIMKYLWRYNGDAHLPEDISVDLDIPLQKLKSELSDLEKEGRVIKLGERYKVRTGFINISL